MNVSMAELKEILTGGPKDVQPTKSEEVTMLGWNIVVLQRGWVVVGEVRRINDEITVRDASVIRCWGTTKGLGQLALSGPTEKTVLDPCGTVTAHIASVVLQMKSDGAKWKQ